MTAQEITVSLHLDPQASRRLLKAASLTHQSHDAFLVRVGDEVARRIVLDWAVAEYRRGSSTFGELAEDTGLAIEEIMEAMAMEADDKSPVVPQAAEIEDVDFQTDPVLYRAIEHVMAALRQRR